jgi:uncharacterized protein
MTELLLRGAQTIGELRGRAARMEPIADVGALRPIIASLMAKGLVVSLTSEGRGQVVTHALYTASEMDRLKTEFRNFDASGGGSDDESAPAHRPVAASVAPAASFASQPRPASSSGGVGAESSTATAALREEVRSLRHELEELREEARSLRRDLDELRAVLS